jgi:uncharacterized protein YjdB
MATTVSAPATVAVGSTINAVARPSRSGGSTPNNPLGTVTWGTSDGTKATVVATPGGVGQSAAITGVATGSATITATDANGDVSTCVVTVVAADAIGFTIVTAPPLVI